MLTQTQKMHARQDCIACSSDRVATLSTGTFNTEPLRSFIAADPWGENPLGHIASEPWTLVRCEECGMKFHRHILTPEWNEVRFSQWMDQASIEQYELEHGNGQNPAREHVEHILRLQGLVGQTARLLDFGCGSGKFLQMARLFGFDAVGVDRSAARQKIAGFEIANELSEVEGGFDVITMFEVLEHLDDPLDLLKQLVARLRPDGVFVVEVPNCSGVTDIVSRETYHKVHPLDHINAFEPQTLVGIMARVGLKPIRKPPVHVTGSPTRLAKDYAKAALKQDTTQRYFSHQSR